MRNINDKINNYWMDNSIHLTIDNIKNYVVMLNMRIKMVEDIKEPLGKETLLIDDEPEYIPKEKPKTKKKITTKKEDSKMTTLDYLESIQKYIEKGKYTKALEAIEMAKKLVK